MPILPPEPEIEARKPNDIKQELLAALGSYTGISELNSRVSRISSEYQLYIACAKESSLEAEGQSKYLVETARAFINKLYATLESAYKNRDPDLTTGDDAEFQPAIYDEGAVDSAISFIDATDEKGNPIQTISMDYKPARPIEYITLEEIQKPKVGQRERWGLIREKLEELVGNQSKYLTAKVITEDQAAEHKRYISSLNILSRRYEEIQKSYDGFAVTLADCIPELSKIVESAQAQVEEIREAIGRDPNNHTNMNRNNNDIPITTGSFKEYLAYTTGASTSTSKASNTGGNNQPDYTSFLNGNLHRELRLILKKANEEIARTTKKFDDSQKRLSEDAIEFAKPDMDYSSFSGFRYQQRYNHNNIIELWAYGQKIADINVKSAKHQQLYMSDFANSKYVQGFVSAVLALYDIPNPFKQKGDYLNALFSEKEDVINFPLSHKSRTNHYVPANLAFINGIPVAILEGGKNFAPFLSLTSDVCKTFGQEANMIVASLAMGRQATYEDIMSPHKKKGQEGGEPDAVDEVIETDIEPQEVKNKGGILRRIFRRNGGR